MDAQLEALLENEIPKLASKLGRIKRQDMDEISPVADLDDVKQTMWLAAVEREQLLVKHLDEGNVHAVRTVLMTAAQRMIRDEVRDQRTRKAVEAGYETYDEEFYSVGSLRRLLPMYLDGGVCETPPASRELTWRVSGGGDGGYGEYLTVMTDIDQAFNRLSEAKRKILSRYFAYPQGSGGWTHNEIAGAMGMAPGELSSRVHRGLRVLQQELGGRNPWGK